MKTARLVLVPVVAIVLAAAVVWSADTSAGRGGPAIEGFGPTYAVPDPDFATPTNRDWRLVFDVASSPESLDAVNPRLETLARFLNLHVGAGVSRERIRLAVVVHGGAGKDLLRDDAYRERFETANPNRLLIEALRGAGVRVVLCGQTAAHRGYGRDELLPGVEVALSAMTALAVLQQDGYALIAF